MIGHAIGLPLNKRKRRSGSGGGATAPAAHTIGRWSWATAGSGQIAVTFLAPVSDGGSPITKYQYKIGAGAWTDFTITSPGFETIGGFTNGTPTALMIRAVNAIGAAGDSDIKTVTAVAGTLPSAFALRDWGVTNRGPGSASIGVQTIPALGSGSIIGIQYRIAGGTWTFLPGWSVGDYTITGITDGAYRTVELRVVTTVGSSAASDIKEVRTGAGVVAEQIAYFGALTVAGAGVYRPLDASGNPVDLTGSAVYVSGTLGPYSANVSASGLGTGLTFSGAAGAPNGCIFTVTLAAGGTVNVKIVTIPDVFHVGSIGQANAAVSAAGFTLGVHVRFRAGWHNPTALAGNVNRTSITPGTWTGTLDIRQGNWVVFTRDPANVTEIGSLLLGQGGNPHRRYWRAHDLAFKSPLTANSNGGGGNGAQLGLESGGNSAPYYAVTDCTFDHTALVTGATYSSAGNGNIGPYTSISINGGPYWIERNRINGSFVGINANTGNGTSLFSYIRRNVLKRSQIDCMLLGTANDLHLEGNVCTDKIWPHFIRTPSAISTGATTTFTVSSTEEMAVDTIVVLRGFTGDFAQFNGRTENPISWTGTTITLPINTTGLTNGLTGLVTYSGQNHGDYIQFTEASGQQQNRVRIRGNRLSRGFADGHWYPDGQGFFGGFTSGQPQRDGWIIEGNVVETSLQRGISIWGLVNSVARANTVVRPLGLDGSTTTSQVAQIIIDGGANNIYRDNLANAFDYGTSAAENTNSVPITLTAPTSAIPALAGNVSLYESHFDNPPTVPDETYDAEVAYAIKTVGGAQGTPAFFAGALNFDFVNLVYANPRGATVAMAFAASNWSVADAVTTGDAIVTIASLPFNGDSPITDIQVSVAGGAWTSLGAAVPGAYPVAGFTDGVATNVNIRAVNAIGASGTSDTKSVTTSAPAAPAAFTAGQWSVVDAVASGQADVTISSLPAPNGSAITALQYSIGGGAWTAFSGITTGTYRISGFTDGNATNLNIRAVNAIGSGATSDTKSVTTSAPTGIVHVANSTVVEQASGTTLTVPLATNIAGDLLVLAICYDNGNNPTTPAGWTLSHTIVGFTANVPEMKIYTKISNGAEGANIAVTVPNRSHIGVTASFRLPNATPIGNVSTANVFSASSRTSPSITAIANSIILHGYTWYPGGALANVLTPPASVTQMFSVRSTIKNGGLWLGWEKRVGGGATVARTLTLDASNGMTGGQVELRSA